MAKTPKPQASKAARRASAKASVFDRVHQGLTEALQHASGDAVPGLVVHVPLNVDVKEIRKRYAKSPAEFERRFGIPARTLEGWEQGRAIDQTARVLLTVIDRDPEAVEKALRRQD